MPGTTKKKTREWLEVGVEENTKAKKNMKNEGMLDDKTTGQNLALLRLGEILAPTCDS